MPETRSGKTARVTEAEKPTETIRHELPPESPGEAMEQTTERRSKTSRSRASTSSSTKARRLAQAKEEIAARKLELAEARLATIQAEDSEEEDRDSIITANSKHTKEVVLSWLNETERVQEKEKEEATNKKKVEEKPIVQAGQIEKQDQKIDLSELASAIAAAARMGDKPHTRYLVDLPYFNGWHLDWLAFKAAYNETSPHFSDIENMARLRKSLRGKAREAVTGLLIANANSQEIVSTLENRFGRADAIALAELERLRGIQKPTDAPRDICIFANKIKNSVATLKVLNRIHYLHNPEIMKTIIEKLTPTIRSRWYDFAAEKYDTEPDLLKFDKFIEREAERCGRFAPPEIIYGDQPTSYRRQRSPPQRSYNTIEKPKCILCDSNEHTPVDCHKLKTIETNARWELAKKRNLCYRCLHQRVRGHKCPPKRCGIEQCQRTHHKLLHFSRRSKEEKTESETEAVSLTLAPKKSRSYLKIIRVRVAGPAGETEAYALLDDGSTVSLVDSKLAEKVGAQGPSDPLHLEAISDTKISAIESRRIALQLTGPSGKSVDFYARTIDNLNLSAHRATEEDIKNCVHLKDIRNEIIYDHTKPNILIGQDNWPLLIATEVRRGRIDQPVASRTKLGWVLHGAHTRTLGQQINFVNNLTTDDRIEEMVKRYFEIDSLGIQAKKTRSDPEARALGILERETKERESGGYETALLWKQEDFTVPNNYNGALNRLECTERKILRDPLLTESYGKQIEELLKKGYAEKVTTTCTNRTWYLPHFAVLHPAKPGKVRVVFDAAARYGGVSLNDHLLSGPDLLQSLPGVLMRFRQHRIALAADIEEMFLRIGIREEDRDMLRFLWRAGKQEEAPQEYRMKSVIFGAASSPCTALYVKNLNAEKHRDAYPEAADAIINHHYMDDYLQSFNSIEEAQRIATEVRLVHRRANFNLRKWTSNVRELAQTLDDSPISTQEVQIEDGYKEEKILGLTWQPSTDTMGFNLDLARVPPEIASGSRIPTKREALKTVMSIFDPLGLVSPITIQGKHILQETWRTGTGWDEPIPHTLEQTWKCWIKDLKRLKDIHIARCHPSLSEAIEREIHTFVDASERTYAAAVYWRAIDRDGNIHVSLAAAKARVAPIKLTSIPRLELQAAVLGCRLAETVKREYQIKACRHYYWTDSKTVLAWLQSGPRTFKAFIAHRVAEIEEFTTVKEWRWLPTKHNVADDATRDPPKDFNQQHRWFTGPEFLYEATHRWPCDTTNEPGVEIEEESVHVTNIENIQIQDALPAIHRFSSWIRLIRTTGRVLQAIDLFKISKSSINYKRTAKNAEKDPAWKAATKKTQIRSRKIIETEKHNYKILDGQYIKRAEELWVKASQQQSFGTEIVLLKQQKSIPAESRLKQLALHLDENDVIKITSRIAAAADIATTQREPTILDGNHYYTRLYLKWTHEQLQHAGAELVVNEVRQHYHVLRLRPTVRSVVKRCFACRLKRIAPASPPTGNHPKSRLAHHVRPFSFVGLDYFGPLSITVGRHKEKRYVALFTCLTTRAVHLEVATNLSADSAVLALRRMIARRGSPKEIYSDNGTNMHGAFKELQEAARDEAAKRAIRWRFLPPAAPFMGGAWERLVRAVKTALNSVLEQKQPHEEVLTTLLCEAEYTVNSRPLTHVPVEAGDEEALTPNHFLMGGSGRVIAPGTFNEKDIDNRKQWRQAQALADRFWTRWVKEYLPDLQYRREPHGKGAPLRLGDLVLIADPNLPRNTWPRGKVIEVFPGTDGVVRSADVKTRGGILRRPTKKLVVLPIEVSTVIAPPQEDAGQGIDAARRENVPDGRRRELCI